MGHLTFDTGGGGALNHFIWDYQPGHLAGKCEVSVKCEDRIHICLCVIAVSTGIE